MKFRLALIGLMVVGPSAARDGNSHMPIPPAGDGRSARELLQQKLNEVQTNNLVRDLMRNPLNLNPQLRDQLLRSPAAADIMRRLRDGDESLMRLVEQIARDHPALRNIDRDALRNLTLEAARKYTGGPGGERNPIANGMEFQPRLVDDAEREAQKIFNEQVQDLMRDWKIEGLAEQLRDTPAFRDMLQDITKNGLKPFQLPGGLKPQQLNLKSLANWLTKVRQHLPKNLPGLSGLRGPSIPPTISNLSFGRPSFPSGFTATGFGEGWSAIITLGLVGIGLGLLWWVIRWKPRRVSFHQKLVPIRVESVNSWPELIRAYEALAINRFGMAAEHWHHRHIEDQIAAKSDPQRVRTLADLYEQARYAAEVQPIANWEPVRTSLRQIHGDLQ